GPWHRRGRGSNSFPARDALSTRRRHGPRRSSGPRRPFRQEREERSSRRRQPAGSVRTCAHLLVGLQGFLSLRGRDSLLGYRKCSGAACAGNKTGGRRPTSARTGSVPVDAERRRRGQLGPLVQREDDQPVLRLGAVVLAGHLAEYEQHRLALRAGLLLL